jgi:glycosyltransferase involved in cell wall biosynthesis
VLLCRTPCVHDSRILREAETLSGLGYEPLIVGVVSEDVRERRGSERGFPILRLEPGSPLSWVRRRLRRRDPGNPGNSPGEAAGSEGPVMTLAIRIHRWLRTMDFYRRAFGVVRRVRPALIHCNDYNTMWVGVAARLSGRAAVVYDAHELWADRNLRPEPRWWLLACESLFVRLAHATLTASPGYAAIMSSRYRIDPPRVIRNIPESERMSEIREANGHPVAVYVGALTTGRGLEISIRALTRLNDVRLRLVGSGHERYRAQLADLARAEGVADRVEFSGAVPPEELLEEISGASVGLALIQPVCLSYRMSLPNKLFEYVAAGLPVLGSDLPAIGGLVSEYGIGLLAEPADPADVAAKLQEMVRPDHNRAFRLAARRAADELRWENESRKLAEAYAAASEAAGAWPPR